MKAALVFACLLLVSCGKGPATPTAAENQQLNDVEVMLNDMASTEANAAD